MGKSSTGVNDMVFSAKEMREFNYLNKKYGTTMGEYTTRKTRKLSEEESAYAILRACCVVTGATFDRVMSRSRHPEDVKARYFAMAFLQEKYPKTPLRVIGRYYLRDHSSVIHANKEIERISNPRYKDPARSLLAQAHKEVAMNIGKYVTR